MRMRADLLLPARRRERQTCGAVGAGALHLPGKQNDSTWLHSIVVVGRHQEFPPGYATMVWCQAASPEIPRSHGAGTGTVRELPLSRQALPGSTPHANGA